LKFLIGPSYNAVHGALNPDNRSVGSIPTGPIKDFGR